MIPGDATFNDLRSSLRGELIRAGDPGYESGRQVWNGMIDRHPLLIARPAGAADVITCVQFARSNGLLLAVRGGGHNVAGFGTCDDGMVIDLSPMKDARVDPQGLSVRAQPGLTWRDLDAETQAFGLATTGGLVSSTGIGGFTLGGGIGWLMRKHGLACDNLLSADVVTADGRLLRASPRENDDLFWGLRGGGGNFGIVTSFEYRLHPVGPAVLGGAIFHPLERARELLAFYREWTRGLPDEVTSMVAVLTAPPAPFIPPEHRGTKMISVALCCSGPGEEGREAVRALNAFAPPASGAIGLMPYTSLQSMFDASAPFGINAYWKTAYLSDLTQGAIDSLVRFAGSMPSPLSAIHIHHAEGAVQRVGEEESAVGHRDSPYILNLLGMCADRGQSEEVTAWARACHREMEPVSNSAGYLNFLGDDGQERIAAAYGPAGFRRLRDLKRKYDPTNLFRVNQNIKPAARSSRARVSGT